MHLDWENQFKKWVRDFNRESPKPEKMKKLVDKYIKTYFFSSNEKTIVK